MPHDSSHSGSCSCSQEAREGAGQKDFLFSKIDRDNVIAFNASQGKKVIKSWADRFDELQFIESESDEQIILQIPFTGSVKLQSIIIKAGPGSMTPTSLKIYANQSHDFSSIPPNPTTTIQFPSSTTREPIEFPLKPSLYPNISHLTLFFENENDDNEEEKSRIYFIGFKGEFKEFIRNPTGLVYELVANPADHKIKGMDGVGSRLG